MPKSFENKKYGHGAVETALTFESEVQYFI